MLLALTSWVNDAGGVGEAERHADGVEEAYRLFDATRRHGPRGLVGQHLFERRSVDPLEHQIREANAGRCLEDADVPGLHDRCSAAGQVGQEGPPRGESPRGASTSSLRGCRGMR